MYEFYNYRGKKSIANSVARYLNTRLKLQPSIVYRTNILTKECRVFPKHVSMKSCTGYYTKPVHTQPKVHPTLTSSNVSI